MHTRRPTLVVVAALGAALTTILSAIGPWSMQPAGAATVRSRNAASAAVAWIITQQRDDGGFGSAEPGFAGFETPDAVLAIADATQTETTYNRRAAFLAVNQVTKNGVSPLHYLDDLADDLASQPANARAGKAAQLALVAIAVGLEPTTFDPDADGATNLVAAMDAAKQGNGSYGNFGGTLFVLLADQALERPAPGDTVAFVEAAQQANGGWGFAGDPTASDEDVDTTSRAIQALVAAGKSPADASLKNALALLARLQNDDGSWSAFGSPDANATAMAILAITAAGYRVDDRCWRDVHGASASSVYTSPDAYLRSQQAADRHIASGSDSYGVNTFATSQAVQALLRHFQPVARRRPVVSDAWVPAGGARRWCLRLRRRDLRRLGGRHRARAADRGCRRHAERPRLLAVCSRRWCLRFR